MTRSVIILGAGGHARVLADALLLRSVVVLGFTDRNPSLTGPGLIGLHILGNDDVVLSHLTTEIQLVNGIGSIGKTRPVDEVRRDGNVRQDIFEAFKHKGYEFMSVVHPTAIIAANTILGEGVQVMAGAILQVGSRVGDNTIINTGVVVDHDCEIGSHVHIAPGATLSGNVWVGDRTHIGVGATVIQGISIGTDCFVAAGAVVVADVPDGVVVMGIPAKKVK